MKPWNSGPLRLAVYKRPESAGHAGGHLGEYVIAHGMTQARARTACVGGGALMLMTDLLFRGRASAARRGLHPTLRRVTSNRCVIGVRRRPGTGLAKC